MIPILDSSQIRATDQYTIEHEPISSTDLMERASIRFVSKFQDLYPGKRSVIIIVAPGNNGGDGLAIARLLSELHYEVEVIAIGNIKKASPDFNINLNRLEMGVNWLTRIEDFPLSNKETILIDGLFGSGLSRKIEGLFAQVIELINRLPNPKVAIDIASGLYTNKPPGLDDAILTPTHTITFQVPKLSHLMPDLCRYTGEVHIVDIQLDEDFIRSSQREYYITEEQDLVSLIPQRNKYDHKGSAGRLQLIAGSKGKIGAAVLTAKAALRAGTGLLYICSPKCGTDILQQSVIEAMVEEDSSEDFIEKMIPFENVNAIGIGPGLGTDLNTIDAFSELLSQLDPSVKLAIDADGINILAKQPELIDLLPPETILTPHPGEFQRLVGEWTDDFHKLELLKAFCKKYKLNLVLKGANSAVCDSSGTIYFNPSGNPGMATAGSGDVLLGIVAGMLAQGLDAVDALKLGVYLHGLAGDLGIKKFGEISLVAHDLIDYLHEAIKTTQKQR
ncbi:MAG: NAD(P)H-hydrate dehydratase [Cyclobacteriaceae bacterium]